MPIFKSKIGTKKLQLKMLANLIKTVSKLDRQSKGAWFQPKTDSKEGLKTL